MRHGQQQEGNIIIIIAVIAAAIAIPAGIYAASPLFINTMIDEQLPVAAGEDNVTEDNSMADKTGDSMMEKSLSGNVVGVGDGIHNAEGVAKVIPLDGSNNNILRLEDLLQLDKRAGPVRDLSTDKQASDFVELGRFKANIGNQKYEIPEGTDLSKYGTVLI